MTRPRASHDLLYLTRYARFHREHEVPIACQTAACARGVGAPSFGKVSTCRENSVFIRIPELIGHRWYTVHYSALGRVPACGFLLASNQALWRRGGWNTLGTHALEAAELLGFLSRNGNDIRWSKPRRRAAGVLAGLEVHPKSAPPPSAGDPSTERLLNRAELVRPDPPGQSRPPEVDCLKPRAECPAAPPSLPDPCRSRSPVFVKSSPRMGPGRAPRSAPAYGLQLRGNRPSRSDRALFAS